MIRLSSRTSLIRTIRYYSILKQNREANAPPLIIRDLERLYNYHYNQLRPEHLPILSQFQTFIDTDSFKRVEVDANEFDHPLCRQCERHWRYIRACNRFNFRCKEVKVSFVEYLQLKHSELRDKLKCQPIIEIVSKYPYFYVGGVNE